MYFYKHQLFLFIYGVNLFTVSKAWVNIDQKQTVCNFSRVLLQRQLF